MFRHGDDFVVSGTRAQQKEFEEPLSEHLIVKHLATLGPCTLNWIVRWVKPPHGSGRERIEYEADPRHAELIIHQLGLSCSSASVSTPNEKSKPGFDLSSVLSAQQCGSHCVSIGHNETVTLRWIDLTCSSRQKNWRVGCKHRQLETWRRSKGSPDT